MPSANITTSGNIISDDFIELLRSEGFTHPALKPETFRLSRDSTNPRIDEEMAAAYDLLREQWDKIRLRIPDFNISDLRTRWLIPLFNLLGFEPLFLKEHPKVVRNDEELRFALSHRGWNSPEAPILHSVPWQQDLDKKIKTSRRHAVSPHDLLQRYLNIADDLWGIVTNGRKLRILRDFHHSLIKGYIEFDLEGIFETGNMADFRALFRMAHASRFIPMPDGKCPLEKFYESSHETGVEVGRKLRAQVKEAIEILANGFLDGELIEQLKNDEQATRDYYRDVLHIVYRLLFLFYVEQKGWLPMKDQRYVESYSVSGLRDLSTDPQALTDEHQDLWEGLKITFRLVRDGYTFKTGEKIPAYGGQLFNGGGRFRLTERSLKNKDLLLAIFKLSFFERKGLLHKINYTHLQVDELGSVYEGLLEFVPRVLEKDEEIDGKPYRAGHFVLDPRGLARKTSGSYYTDRRLVNALIESALKPVIEERLKEAEQNAIDSDKLRLNREKALLSIKVCDPAAGSGAFLVAAMEELGHALARVRCENEEPDEPLVLQAKRDVLQNCIYGVDLNEMAVELCKVSLWIAAAMPDFPLAFLDDKIKCGNSLIGVPLPKQVQQAKIAFQNKKDEIIQQIKNLPPNQRSRKLIQKNAHRFNGWPETIPVEAFKPVSNDHIPTARALANQHKAELKTMAHTEDAFTNLYVEESLYKTFASIKGLPQDDVGMVQEKEAAYWEWKQIEERSLSHRLADTWTAAFFWEFKKDGIDAPTQNVFENLSKGIRLEEKRAKEMNRLSTEYRFFHWHLSFPDVFKQDGSGGFDVVLGNPPWEKIKLEEQQFFAFRDPTIANATNKAARQKMIEHLIEENPKLFTEFMSAKHSAEALSKFLRYGGRFPLTAKGDINTYALFSELAINLINKDGRVGIIVPSGIATDDTTKDYFRHIMENKKLVSLYDFENREGLFPNVHRSYKFCLLTLSNKKVEHSQFLFFATNIDHLRDERRRFSLTPQDLALINPNTRTCPIFRTKYDAELTKKIYRNVPVLINEQTGENPWGISFMRMFDMSNDSHLFKTRAELEAMGYRLQGNRFVRDEDDVYLPLYEAKMIWQYDHRYGSFEQLLNGRGTNTSLPTPSLDQYQNFNYFVLPFYWIHSNLVLNKLQDIYKNYQIKWLQIYRFSTGPTNERTMISAIIPYAASNHIAPLMFLTLRRKQFIFLANINTLVYDFILRNKMGRQGLDVFFIKQTPVLNPNIYSIKDEIFIGKRVIELVCTNIELIDFGYEIIDYLNKRGYKININLPIKFDTLRRQLLKSEIDAYFAKLYGLTRDELHYILDPQEVMGPNYPGQTFPGLKNNELRKYGEYRTKRLILEAWDKLERGELG